MADNAYWFARAAQAARDIIDEHGGAVIMTRSELRETVIEEDSHLLACPLNVLTHMQCALKRQNLACSAYRVQDNSILLIHDMRIGVDEARVRAETDGLSEAVHIALFEAHVAEVHA